MSWLLAGTCFWPPQNGSFGFEANGEIKDFHWQCEIHKQSQRKKSSKEVYRQQSQGSVVTSAFSAHVVFGIARSKILSFDWQVQEHNDGELEWNEIVKGRMSKKSGKQDFGKINSKQRDAVTRLEMFMAVLSKAGIWIMDTLNPEPKPHLYPLGYIKSRSLGNL